MSPWLFLGWVVAASVALIVAVFAIAAAIALVRASVGKGPKSRRSVNS